MLCNSNKTWHVVRISVDRTDTINAIGETVRDRLGYDTVDCSTVNALEECENVGVLGSRRREGANVLDSEMGVADDGALGVNLLGSGVVVGLSVDEIAGVEVVDRHRDGESGVGLDVLTVHGRHKLGRWHVRSRSDDTHWCGVAGTSLDLLTIRDRQIGNGQAEIDEIVGRGEGGDLASNGRALAVVCETLCDNSRIES